MSRQNHPRRGKEFVIEQVCRKDYEEFRRDLPIIIEETKKFIKNTNSTNQLDYDPLRYIVTLFVVKEKQKIPFIGWPDEKYFSKEDFELAQRVNQYLKCKLDYLFQLALD